MQVYELDTSGENTRKGEGARGEGVMYAFLKLKGRYNCIILQMSYFQVLFYNERFLGLRDFQFDAIFL